MAVPQLAAVLLASITGCGAQPGTTGAIKTIVSISSTQHLAEITVSDGPDSVAGPQRYVLVNVGGGQYRCVYHPGGGVLSPSDADAAARVIGYSVSGRELYDVLYGGKTAAHESVNTPVVVSRRRDGGYDVRAVNAAQARAYNAQLRERERMVNHPIVQPVPQATD